MNNHHLHLPTFPLAIFLLPGGITRLRIFEQRYLKMIRIASKGSGFVIAAMGASDTQEDTQDKEWGSWVDIVNFDQGDDGVLEVDVKCKCLVDLLSIQTDEGNLKFSDVKITTHWSDNDANSGSTSLFNTLSSVFEKNPMLKNLYKNDMTDNTSWVIARWLEILPVNLEVKSLFSTTNSFQSAQEFVNSVVLSKNQDKAK